MSEGLKPCPHRKVDESGHILCSWIRAGDRQVSLDLCRACPVPQINCEHLRAAVEKTTPAPITVQFATGRIEVWDDKPPAIRFQQAACAAKTMPIHSPKDCVGCSLRAPQVVPQNALPVTVAERSPAPVATATIATGAPAAATATSQELTARAKLLAERKLQERVASRVQGAANSRRQVEEKSPLKSKIILLQEWLTGQTTKKTKPNLPAPIQPDEDGVAEIVYSPIASSYQEEPGLERCVGWTD